MSATGVLQHLSQALDRIGIDYMLTGSFASSHYGASRSTQDIDIVIEATPERLRALVETLAAENYYAEVDTALEALRNRSMFNLLELSSGWKIDLIIRKARPFSVVEFHRRRRIQFDGIRLFIASAEDVMIAKMEWSKMAESSRQLDDVAAIMQVQGENLDWSYLKTWTVSLQLEKQWHEVCKRAGVNE
jgi:hypothetical protein